MTARYLMVYLLVAGQYLHLGEIFAYSEITIAHEGNSLGTTATVTLGPSPLDGAVGTNIYKGNFIALTLDPDAKNYMALTDNTAEAFYTYVQITFANAVHLKGVLVVGAVDAESDGYPTIVETYDVSSYSACGAELAATCDTAICDAYTAIIAVSRTTDYRYLSLGAILVFECLITDFTAPYLDDATYTLGEAAIYRAFVPIVTADCTSSEYASEATISFWVLD